MAWLVSGVSLSRCEMVGKEGRGERLRFLLKTQLDPFSSLSKSNDSTPFFPPRSNT